MLNCFSFVVVVYNIHTYVYFIHFITTTLSILCCRCPTTRRFHSVNAPSFIYDGYVIVHTTHTGFCKTHFAVMCISACRHRIKIIEYYEIESDDIKMTLRSVAEESISDERTVADDTINAAAVDDGEFTLQTLLKQQSYQHNNDDDGRNIEYAKDLPCLAKVFVVFGVFMVAVAVTYYTTIQPSKFSFQFLFSRIYL